MIRFILSLTVLTALQYSCQSEKVQEEKSDYVATIMTLDPGHFHSFLLQKNMYQDINPVAYVYAPEGSDVRQHLSKIEEFNNRSEDPTHWKEVVYTEPDFADKLFSEKPGNVLVVAGKNQKKTDYILRAVENDIHVYSDKPMAIDGENYKKLKKAFEIADKKGLAVYDIMTQRYEITSILQRQLSTISSIFGEIAANSPENPAITQESIHHISKVVAGSPLIRPAWFFDVEQQGSGIVDINTHLVDLIMWTLYPKENLKPSDVEIAIARQWATQFTPALFKKVTGLDQYPDYLQKNVIQDSVLKVNTNGAITFKLKDVYGKASVTWNYEAPPGGQDAHYAIFRGTKSNLVLRSDKSTNFKTALFVEPIGSYDKSEWSEKMKAAMTEIHEDYPNVAFEESEKGFEIIIPEEYKISHEAHFALVTEKYLDFIKSGSLPQWEKDFMLTKYYITTEAFEKSRAGME